jgi:hypothetical protein
VVDSPLEPLVQGDVAGAGDLVEQLGPRKHGYVGWIGHQKNST